jgi:hypothetical protein
MSEKPTPRAVSEEAGKLRKAYERQSDHAEYSEINAQRDRESASRSNMASRGYNMVGVQPVVDTSKPAALLTPGIYEKMSPEALAEKGGQEYLEGKASQRDLLVRQAGEWALAHTTAKMAADEALQESKEHYKANEGAYFDAAHAEAMLDGVHINVQQQQEAAQPVEVHHAA